MTDGPSAEQPVVRETVLDVRLPKTVAVERIEGRRIQILPGAAVGLHVHNGPVVGTVIEGSVVYQIEGRPESVLHAGDVFYEPEGARIARFDATDDGVTFIGFFPLAADQEAELTFLDG
jgi:quercetin dioxygenase-like cupin family protein